MKRCSKLALGLLAVFVIMPSYAREPLTLELLKDRAAVDAATPEGQAYLKEFFTNPWRLAFDAAEHRCRAAAQAGSGTHEPFVVALSIGDNGLPTDVLVSPDDDAMRCRADGLKASTFIKPPHDGFAIYMMFKATEPGTEGRSSAPVASKTSNP
jgi:hypothetical protein